MIGHRPPTLQDDMISQRASRELFEQAKAYAYAYLDGIDQRPVFPATAAIEGLSVFNELLPRAPASPDEILRLLHVHGSPATVAQAGGRYFGFVNGGALPAALAARWLADVWDQNADGRSLLAWGSSACAARLRSNLSNASRLGLHVPCAAGRGW